MIMLVCGALLLVATRSVADLVFSPADLMEFSNCPAMIPGQKTFTITNNYNRDVLVKAVTSESSNFHTVLFQSATLHPSEELSVHILFLPYYAETVHSVLNIDTSEGETQYYVTGRATPNPYKVQPYLGQRLLHGSTPQDQPITIYNPHKETLYIREVFTTEDFLSLKGGPLLSSSKRGQVFEHQAANETLLIDAATKLWTVDPGVEKEIIVLSIMASTSGKFAGYVHIRTSQDDILLPVELQVLDNVNTLRAREASVDFGVLAAVGQKSFVDLWLQNTGPTDVEILEIITVKPDPLLKIIPIARHVLADKGTEFLVAQLVYTAEGLNNRDLNVHKGENSIMVFTDDLNPINAVLEVPYQASVLLGGITLDDIGDDEDQQNTFLLPPRDGIEKSEIPSRNSEEDFISKDFYLTNSFSEPIKLLSVNAASCGDIICIDAPFLWDSTHCNGTASNRSLGGRSRNDKRMKKKMRGQYKQSKTDQLLHATIAQSSQQWPPITVTFNRKLAASRSESGILSYSSTPAVQGMARHIPSTHPYGPFTCWLEVLSNKSSHRFPLHVVDGDVNLSYMDAEFLKVESLSKEESRTSTCPTDVSKSSADSGMIKQKISSKWDTLQSVLNIDLGVISSREPPPLKVSFSNYNSVDIPLFLSHASGAACVCRDVSWPLGRNDGDEARRIMTNMQYGQTLLAAEREQGRCFCHSGRDADGELEDAGMCTRYHSIEMSDKIDHVIPKPVPVNSSAIKKIDGEKERKVTADTNIDAALNAMETELVKQGNWYAKNIFGKENNEPMLISSIYEDLDAKEMKLEMLTTERDMLIREVDELILKRKILVAREQVVEENGKVKKVHNSAWSIASANEHHRSEYNEHYDNLDTSEDSPMPYKEEYSAALTYQLEKLRESQHASRPLGKPLSSFGLLYECGKISIGAARAGYNNLFRLHLNSPIQLQHSGDPLSLEVTTVQLATPHRNISLALHYRPSYEKITSRTYSDDVLHENIAISEYESPPSFLIGGSPSSVTVISTLSEGPLLSSWINLMELRNKEKEIRRGIRGKRENMQYEEENQCGCVAREVAVEEDWGDFDNSEEHSITSTLDSDKYFLKSFLVQGNTDSDDDDDAEIGSQDLFWATVITPVSISNLFSDFDLRKAKILPSSDYARTTLSLDKVLSRDAGAKISDVIAAVNQEISAKMKESWPAHPSLFTWTYKTLSKYPTNSPAEKKHILDYMEALREFQRCFFSGYLPSAHEIFLVLQSRWLRMFPRGQLRLPPVTLVTHAPGTLHRHIITEMSLESPLPLIPALNDIKLPYIRPNEVMVFYIKVENVFDVPISVALRGNIEYSADWNEVNGVRDESTGPKKKIHTAQMKSNDIDLWHEWLQKKCQQKQSVGNGKDNNENCNIPHYNMDNRTLLYDWYKKHHHEKKTEKKSFHHSIPTFSALMSSSDMSSLSQNEIDVLTATSRVVQGAEVSVYNDVDKLSSLSGAVSSNFLVHPFAEIDLNRYFLAPFDDDEEQNFKPKWGRTLAPREIAYLGPIVFVPTASVPFSRDVYNESIYVINSFGGIDRVSLTARSDIANVTVKSVAVIPGSPGKTNTTYGVLSDMKVHKEGVVTGDKESFIAAAAMSERRSTSVSLEVDSIDDKIIVTFANEGLVEGNIIYASWDGDLCVDVSGSWFLSGIQMLFNRRTFAACNSIKLPRALAGHQNSPKSGKNSNSFNITTDFEREKENEKEKEKDSSESDTKSRNNNNNSDNTNSEMIVYIPASNVLGDCVFEKCRTLLELYLSADSIAEAPGKFPRSAVLLQIDTYLSDRKKAECYNTVRGIPIWGFSETGEDVELGLFLLLLSATIVLGVYTIVMLLIAGGKQTKKRYSMLALIKRDLHTPPDPPLTKDSGDDGRQKITSAAHTDSRNTIGQSSLLKVSYHLNAAYDLSDIRTESTEGPTKLRMNQVNLLKGKRKKDAESAVQDPPLIRDFPILEIVTSQPRISRKVQTTAVKKSESDRKIRIATTSYSSATASPLASVSDDANESGAVVSLIDFLKVAGKSLTPDGVTDTSANRDALSKAEELESHVEDAIAHANNGIEVGRCGEEETPEQLVDGVRDEPMMDGVHDGTLETSDAMKGKEAAMTVTERDDITLEKLDTIQGEETVDVVQSKEAVVAVIDRHDDTMDTIDVVQGVGDVVIVTDIDDVKVEIIDLVQAKDGVDAMQGKETAETVTDSDRDEVEVETVDTIQEKETVDIVQGKEAVVSVIGRDDDIKMETLDAVQGKESVLKMADIDDVEAEAIGVAQGKETAATAIAMDGQRDEVKEVVAVSDDEETAVILRSESDALKEEEALLRSYFDIRDTLEVMDDSSMGHTKFGGTNGVVRKFSSKQDMPPKNLSLDVTVEEFSRGNEGERLVIGERDGAFDSTSMSPSVQSNHLSSSWGSLSADDVIAMAVVDSEDGRDGREDTAIKNNILKDLSWASRAPPLPPGIFSTSSTSFKEPHPSYALPHLDSFDTADVGDFVNFSTRGNKSDILSSDLYAAENNFSLRKKFPATAPGFPDEDTYQHPQFYSPSYLEENEYADATFSDNIFPSENNISGDIATELLADAVEVRAWAGDLIDYNLNSKSPTNARFVEDYSNMFSKSTRVGKTSSDDRDVFHGNNDNKRNSAVTQNNMNHTLTVNNSEYARKSYDNNFNAAKLPISNRDAFQSISTAKKTPGKFIESGDTSTTIARPANLILHTEKNTNNMHDNNDIYSNKQQNHPRNFDNTNSISSVSHLNNQNTPNMLNMGDNSGPFYADRELFSESGQWRQNLGSPKRGVHYPNTSGYHDNHFDNTSARTHPTRGSNFNDTVMRSRPASASAIYYETEIVETDENEDWLHGLINSRDRDQVRRPQNIQGSAFRFHNEPPHSRLLSPVRNAAMRRSSDFNSYGMNRYNEEYSVNMSQARGRIHYSPESSAYDSHSHAHGQRLPPTSPHTQLRESAQLQHLHRRQHLVQQREHNQHNHHPIQQLTPQQQIQQQQQEQRLASFQPPLQPSLHQPQQTQTLSQSLSPLPQSQKQQPSLLQSQQQQQVGRPKSGLAPPPGFEARPH